MGDLSEYSTTTKDFFIDFFNSIGAAHLINKAHNTVLKAEKINNNGYVIKGIIHFGDYGYSAQGFNVVENEISYLRTYNDSELTPHYFLVYLPSDRSTGIILLQRFGVKSIFTTLKQKFTSEFSSKFPNYNLALYPQVPSEVFNSLREGSLKSIKIVRYVAPDDIAETIKKLGFEEQEGVLSIEFKAKRKGTLLKPAWMNSENFTNNNSFCEMDLRNISLEGEIQIFVDYLGKRRKICLDNPRKISPYIDATDEVDITSSGHPSFDSIDRYCENLLDLLLKEMGSQRHV